MADRTPNELADRLSELADGGEWVVASTHSPECWRYHEHCAYLAAAARLRALHERDTALTEAIGDPEDLRRWCDRSPGVAIGVLRRIAAALDAGVDRD